MITKFVYFDKINFRSFFSIPRKMAFFGALIAGFLTHLSLMILQPVCADPVLFMDIFHFGNWEKWTMGRWAINFFPMLRGYFISPVVSTLIAIVSVSIGAIFIVDLYGIKGSATSLLTGILMAVHPNIANPFMYYSTSGTLWFAISIFPVCLMYCYFKQMKPVLKIPLTIIIVTFILGRSQNFISTLTFLSLSALIVQLLRGDSDKKILIRNFLILAFICLISGLLYLKIWKLGVTAHDIQVFYGGAENYSLRNSILNLPHTIKEIYQTFHSYFWKDTLLHNSHWHRQWFNGFVLAASAILFIRELHNKYKSKILSKVDIIIIFVSLLLLPIAAQSISLVVTGYQFYLLMAQAFIFIFPFLFAIAEMGGYSEIITFIPNFIILLGTAVICWTFALSDNAGYSLLNHTFIQTKELASRVLCRLEDQPEFDYDMQVYFIGQPSAESFRQDTDLIEASPGSTFSQQGVWSSIGENTQGWGLYIYRYCGVRLKTYYWEIGDRIKELAETEDFKTRGAFPAQDSVGMIDGEMVVKLGDYPYE